MLIKDIIKGIRKNLGLTQQQFAGELGIKRSLIGAYEEGRAEPRLELLYRIAELGGMTLDSFFGTNIKGIAGSTRVKNFGNFIPLVPVKASAGYLQGYADPEVINEFPTISIPFLAKGNYRAFEISGDSMLPLASGSIVIAEKVERFEEIRIGRGYVLVTRKEGVIYKRVESVFKDLSGLQLSSDNKKYPPFHLKGTDLMEVWLAKAFISYVGDL